ncbi:MAG: tetratricopeptide repeat protein [Rhodospirillaceae bacterium]|jgi:tetratricopeptide (TPR) repeat protein|nr:tetratricopeptide repeat protein [Rhodospirillaceae bacterium]
MNAGQLLQEALAHHQAGRLQDALPLYQKALELEPDQPDALHLCGLVCHQVGRGEQAAELIGRAVEINGDSALYRTNFAIVLNMIGRFSEAEEAADGATKLAADNAEAWHHLGISRLGQQKFADAEAALTKATKLEPNNSEYLNNLGTAYRNLGQNDQAVETFRRAVDSDPDFAVGQTNLAEALKGLGEIAEAEALCLKIIESHPDHASAYHVLGGVMMVRMAYTAAVEAFNKYIELVPNQTKGYVALASVQNILAEYDAAEKNLNRALEINPQSASTLQSIGSLLLQKGDKINAVEKFKAVIALDPDISQAYFDIVSAGIEDLTPDNTAHLKLIVQRDDVTDANKSTARFTLARVAEKAGESVASFEHLTAANELRLSVLEKFGYRFDAEQLASEFQNYRDFFTAEFFDQAKDRGQSSEVPVFVIGLPRTGTTLVERIIASHAEAEGAGELLEIEKIVNELKRNQLTYPDCLAELKPAKIKKMAAGYLNHLQSFNESAVRIVDKNPFNFIHLGLITFLFPKAKIIHCRRDLRDVGYSCFSQNFSDPVPWTNDLRSIGQYFKQYESLMVHWEKYLPASILSLEYEDLVTDFANQAKLIIEHIGLAWDENCLKFYDSAGAVQTASSTQVREPVNTRSIGRWQPYAEQLKPLIEVLEMD